MDLVNKINLRDSADANVHTPSKNNFIFFEQNYLFYDH